MTPGQRKQILRDVVKARLAALSQSERQRQSRAVCELLAKAIAPTEGKRILLFAPPASGTPEIDLSPLLLGEVACSGAVLCLPRMDWQARTMAAHQFAAGPQALADTEIRRHGVHEPLADSPVLPAHQLDVIVLPGVAFDGRGGRLGRGGGYYDRFLADSRVRALRIGACFCEQFVPEVPMEEHDGTVDRVVTADGVSGPF